MTTERTPGIMTILARFRVRAPDRPLSYHCREATAIEEAESLLPASSTIEISTRSPRTGASTWDVFRVVTPTDHHA